MSYTITVPYKQLDTDPKKQSWLKILQVLAVMSVPDSVLYMSTLLYICFNTVCWVASIIIITLDIASGWNLYNLNFALAVFTLCLYTILFATMCYKDKYHIRKALFLIGNVASIFLIYNTGLMSFVFSRYLQ